MGDFNAHLTAGKRYAILVLAIAGFIGIQWGYSITNTVLLAVVAAAYGLLASLLPDIDHQDSKPRQAAGKYASLGVIAAIILLPTFAPDLTQGLGRVIALIGFSGSLEVLGSGVLLIGGGALLVFGGSLFDRSLTHRGFTHSLPFAFLLAIAAYFSLSVLASVLHGFSFLTGQAGAIISLSTFGGILVHLAIDR